MDEEIKITKIELSNCGPIQVFKKKISPLTVIFARNESGKTTIVENIIKALFSKNYLRNEFIRDQDFVNKNTRITISGLEEKVRIFSPFIDEKQKLDIILLEQDENLAKNLFKLLYVKSAQTQIIEQQGGIDKKTIKDLFSNQKAYDTILDSIRTVVDKTGYDNDMITGDKREKNYRDYEDALALLKKIKDLTEEFFASQASTIALKINRDLSRLKQEYEDFNEAKKYYAFCLNHKIKNLQKEIVIISDLEVDKLTNDLNELARIKNLIAENQKKTNAYKDVEKDLLWLENAKNIYYKNLGASKGFNVLLLLSFICVIAGIITNFIDPVFGLIPLIITLVWIVIYYILIKFKGESQKSIRLINKIKEEYRKKFNEVFSLPNLETKIKILNEKNTEKKILKDQLISIERQLTGLRSSLENRLDNLGIDKQAEEEWNNQFNNFKNQWRKKKDETNDLQATLERLNIDPSDYRETKTSVEYSEYRVNEINRQIQEKQQALEQENEKIKKIRERLIEIIGHDTAINGKIEHIAQALEEKKEEQQNIINNCSSTIIAAHIINEEIKNLTRRIDQELEAHLNHKTITQILKNITGRYNKIEFSGEEIYLKDDNQELFNLNYLSSGAKEQILLALRMGIAQKITGNKRLFLILDDAFQYSDWQRRQKLIDQVCNIVLQGWQVIYFTMDDDIRDRFLKKQPALKQNIFCYIEL